MFSKNNAVLVVIDMQEKLCKVMKNLDRTTKNIRLLIEAANEFNMPIIYTEQYPKGLGETIEPLKSLLEKYNAERFDKMSFSALKIDEIAKRIEELGRKTVVLTGIESHICVLSTAVDLKAKGYNVVIAKDATTSREDEFYSTAMDFYNGYGISVVPAETLVFYWLEFAGTESFKKLQRIILGKD
ncbi:isochorismatase family protein [Hippea sp. KM1]|uniref:isochorismatase family protein n=1 Tax=Hippea sp. KM1 TaxID=944481 RepID=UPI00046D21CD|nr:isochorismatase family protein [Hippea sp. KM1]